MKKLCAILLLAGFAMGFMPKAIFAQAGAKRTTTQKAPKSSQKRSAERPAGATKQVANPALKGYRTPRNPADPFDVFVSHIPMPAFGSFAECMDNYCLSADFEEKGRCRCSDTLPEIERTLRQIETTTRDADLLGKQLEVMQGVANGVIIDIAMGDIHSGIAAMEKRARIARSRNIDPKSGVSEGENLMIWSAMTCSPLINDLDDDAQSEIDQAYGRLLEKDCNAYTAALDDLFSNAQSRLESAEENMTKFADLEFQKHNILGFSACRREFEGCAANECGHQFSKCRGEAATDSVISKCETKNIGKCDDMKAIILVDLRELIAFELSKEDLRAACNKSGGRVVSGRCVHTVCRPIIVERTNKKCGRWELWCKTKKAASFTFDAIVSTAAGAVVGAVESAKKSIGGTWDLVAGTVTADGAQILKGLKGVSFDNIKASTVDSWVGIGESVKIDYETNFKGTTNQFEDCDHDVPLSAPGFAQDGFPSDDKFKGALI